MEKHASPQNVPLYETVDSSIVTDGYATRNCCPSDDFGARVPIVSASLNRRCRLAKWRKPVRFVNALVAIIAGTAAVGGVDTIVSVADFCSVPLQMQRINIGRAASAPVDDVPSRPPVQAGDRLPAEFERQSGIVMASKAWDDYSQEFVEIAAALRNRVPVILMINGTTDLARSLARCIRSGVTLSGIRHVEVPHDTAWKIVDINAERMAKNGGALHCLTRNLAAPVRVPWFYSPGADGKIRTAGLMTFLAVWIADGKSRLSRVRQERRARRRSSCRRIRHSVRSRSLPTVVSRG